MKFANVWSTASAPPDREAIEAAAGMPPGTLEPYSPDQPFALFGIWRGYRWRVEQIEPLRWDRRRWEVELRADEGRPMRWAGPDVLRIVLRAVEFLDRLGGPHA